MTGFGSRLPPPDRQHRRLPDCQHRPLPDRQHRPPPGCQHRPPPGCQHRPPPGCQHRRLPDCQHRHPPACPGDPTPHGARGSLCRIPPLWLFTDSRRCPTPVPPSRVCHAVWPVWSSGTTAILTVPPWDVRSRGSAGRAGWCWSWRATPGWPPRYAPGSICAAGTGRDRCGPKASSRARRTGSLTCAAPRGREPGLPSSRPCSPRQVTRRQRRSVPFAGPPSPAAR